ncbi:10975_t:CDS:1, partial [Acaulospora morrowiae]
GPTLVVIKVRNSGEIIGGYNPLEWLGGGDISLIDYDNYDQCETPNSFIFSLSNRAIPILSRVSSKKEAIIWCGSKGPCFGLKDLHIIPSNFYNNIVCESRNYSYEKKIINKEIFEIEDYEVFQIIDERFSQRINRKFRGSFLFFMRWFGKMFENNSCFQTEFWTTPKGAALITAIITINLFLLYLFFLKIL